MMKVSDAREIIKKQSSVSADTKESDEKVSAIFNTMVEAEQIKGSIYTLSSPDTIFKYPVGIYDQKASSTLITKRDIAVPEHAGSHQLLLEIYYDPQFYDLEILVESKDDNEVRAHMYNHFRNVDITQYKGSKRVHIEAEEGDYTLKIIAKFPAGASDTEEFHVKFVEFQLYVVSSETIPSKSLRPSSLNYFGLLGPTGENFGQLVHLLNDVMLEPKAFIDLEFSLAGGIDKDNGGPTVDVQALESDGESE